MASRTRLGAPLLDKIDLRRAEAAGGAVIVPSEAGIQIVTPPAAWAFAAAILIAHASDDPASAVVEIDVAATDGPAAFTFVTLDMRRDVARSISIDAGAAGPISCAISDFKSAGWILVRNGGIDGKSTNLKISAVRILPASAEQLPIVTDAAPGRLGRVDLALLAAVADAVEDVSAPLATPEPILLDAVPVELLGDRLGYAAPFDAATASRKPLTQWRMEDDDQQIFRYLYRNAQPRRHLEFGTWYGAGTVYCLEETAATVWTMNLPEGERKTDGTVAYGAGAASDSGSMIGRLYIDAGLGHRVCQIYCDTRQWDTANYPGDFFDSVLIDGGHQADVVISDTMKALKVLRSGGLCLWHDFAADGAIFASSPASIGVTQGIRALWPTIMAEMRDVFWIYPSFILAGVRR